MPASTIFARIKPESFKVSEEYHYEVNPWRQIPAHPKPSEEPNRKGQIEIVFPYDGEKTFTEEVRKAITRQDHQIWQQNDATIRIGYLGLTNYQRTDLGAGLGLGSEHDTIALDLPVNEAALSPDDLLLDRHACKFSHNYLPAAPGEPPLELSLQIFDEITLGDLPDVCWNRLEPSSGEIEPEPVKLPDHLLPVLQRHDSFERSLLFEFRLALKLPRSLTGSSQTPPTLESLSLQWPAPFAIHRARATVILPNGECQSRPPLYNPETKEIVCRQLPLFSLPASERDQKTVFFQSARIRLAIQHPGEMFGVDALRGVAHLKLPGVLSGVEALLFDAAGERSDCAVTYETKLRLDFELDPTEYAQIKNYTPYHVLQFEGVLIEEARIADIKTVLYDLGFAVRSTRLQRADRNDEQYLMVAHQRHGADEMWLLILVHGRVDRTERQRSLRGDHTYRTTIETGCLTVRIRGKLTGEHGALVQHINEVQVRLKHLFQYASIAQ